ncbi:MAG: immunity 53 family protein [Acidobacteria bacterium]|nr:immunity 53 family protein [Acidobacteriota bacterium]
MNSIEKIQSWYASQCDGDWEHQFGIAIETIDNPGWSVEIDLKGTGLEINSIDSYIFEEDKGEKDWIICEIRDNKFVGYGDENKLQLILESFIKLIGI